MKKQFFRVKQLADQTFSRAGKTEALSDDLQGAERRIDFIKNVCQSSAKKLNSPGVASDNSAREKRLKKNPDYCLGASMIESASGEEDRLLREVVTHCGKLLMCLATSHVEHEIKVEARVVNPLSNICDNDYPNIIKQKKNLTKLILDMDSARARYQTAVKHYASSAGSKADSIKDEFEEAELKVEQCRDLLACDMLQMMSRESDVSQTILEYARLQRDYHTTALAILDEIIPEIEIAIDESPCRPVFGRPLDEHLKVSGRKIAYPIELCVCALMELGMGEEGLFRVTAGASKVKRMKLSIDANWPNLDLNSALQVRDPHVFSGVLKSYLRELPEPLLTHKLYEQWMAAARIMSGGQSEAGLKALWSALKSLPQTNLNNLHYLIKFFSSLASNKHANKMTTQNLAIVIAPNLLWAPSEDSSMGLNMNTANLQSVIVDTLISYVDWFFPDMEVDFYQTFTRPDISPRMPNGHVNNDDGDNSIPHHHHQSHHPGQHQMSHHGQSVHYNQSMHHHQPEIIMKRTQSNSSLSDQHSPPQGSPKPATRSRRQKPAAPNPPVNRQSFSAGKPLNVAASSLVKEDQQQTKEHDQRLRPPDHQSKPQPSLDRSPGNPFEEEAADIAGRPGNPFDSGEDEEAGAEAKITTVPAPTTPTARCRNSLQTTDDSTATSKPTTKPLQTNETSVSTGESSDTASAGSATDVDNRPSDTRSSRQDITFSAYEKEPPINLERRGLERGMSKSGEGLDTARHLERTGSSVEHRRPDRPERPYSTLDRKKPSSSRPVPAPRVTLESSVLSPRSSQDASKPSIPERPANLPRPHSSSFRITRSTLDSPDQTDNPVNLERAHMYTVDKQQVSFVNFDKPSDKNDGADKPEKPKKPSYLPQTGHQRAMSEGSIIDTGLDRLKVQMPTPPPPPPETAPGVATSSNQSDSTNL